MPHQIVLPRRLRIVVVLLFVLLLLIAAAINVPWALTFMQSRSSISQVPMAVVRGAEVTRTWPSKPPHDQPWPMPDYWAEGRTLGCRVYNVRTTQQTFAMEVQHLGWPLPVIELKQMWWDWHDAAFAGPESDPAPSLLLRGLVLNPLILGGGAWFVLVLPWLSAIVAARRYRRRLSRCLDCGYPAKSGSPNCTECGSTL